MPSTATSTTRPRLARSFRTNSRTVGESSTARTRFCFLPISSRLFGCIWVKGPSRTSFSIDLIRSSTSTIRTGEPSSISAAALMEDGSPVLIVDVDDLIRSIEKLVREGPLTQMQPNSLELIGRKQKRVLAVDDSPTVRELVRKLLASHGYLADVAVDGMDGWNAVRAGHYDLVITDVDMPRLDGIELAALIKKDPQFKSVPVMIVSYKDREEDRLRGLEAGADYYITKGSFHDETLLQAVVDLIGNPDT